MLAIKQNKRGVTMAIRRNPASQSEVQNTVSSEGKIRVQFDFTPNAYARLGEIMNKSGAASRAETVRNALSLYEWFINEVDPDDTIQVKSPDGEITSSFKAKLLRRL
jgi:hypothetical protein